jgi:superfamily II DNA helicase RecQ
MAGAPAQRAAEASSLDPLWARSSMQLRFFTIPLLGGEVAAEELNRFLASHRILAVDRHLAQDSGVSIWAVCVSYEPAGESRAGDSRSASGRRGKVDYREVLSEADFTVYARLRTLRKEIADSEGVPVYSLFTNEQLAEMITRRVSSATALREISGIGEARVQKYGEAFLSALVEARSAPSAADGSGDHEA